MIKQIKSYLNLFWQLLRTDLFIYKNSIRDEIINGIIWFICIIAIMGYMFPQLGMNKGYGSFVAISSIVSAAFWEIWSTSTAFIADLDGDQTITYFFTLPIPTALIYIKQIVGYAIKSATTSIIMFPLGKLLLGNRLDLSHFSIPKFMLIFIILNLFVGALSLFTASLIKDMNHVSNVSMRILFPMWYFSASQVSWATMSTISPTFAKICLLNPLVFAMEGTRAAVFGQPGSLPFSLCVSVLICSTILLTTLAIITLKKRLDFV